MKCIHCNSNNVHLHGMPNHIYPGWFHCYDCGAKFSSNNPKVDKREAEQIFGSSSATSKANAEKYR